MKQKLTSLIAILLTSISSWAYTFSAGGIDYNVTNQASKTVEVAPDFQTSSEKVVIPRQVVNKGVTYTVTGIGERAFSHCSRLSNVTIPNTVKYIKEWAFYDCRSLYNVTIPNSVVTIEKYAFSNNNLMAVKIPGSVKEIGERAFSNGSFLNTITVDQSNHTFDSRDNCNAIIETATNTLICGCTSTIIPSSVTAIGSHAFYECPNITNILITKSIINIGKEAFSGCGNLDKITVEKGNPRYDSRDNCNAIIETATNCLIVGCWKTVIPNTVKSIGESAFHGCTALTRVKIPSNVELIGYDAFGYSGLETVEIPGSVKRIKAWAFQSCSELKKITLSDGIESMEDCVIYDCPKIQSIIIPKTLKLNNYSVGFCPNLSSISVEPGNPHLDSRDNCNAIIETKTNTLLLGCKNTIIPNTVTQIATNAFKNYKGLKIIIPKNVSSIGEEAFIGCDSILSISVASDNPFFDSRDNCNAIIETATGKLIKGCDLTTIPRGVKSIEDRALQGCSKISRIILPEGLTSIGNYAFFGCDNLSDIKIPSTLTSIGRYAFGRTPWLTEYNKNTKNIFNNIIYINDVACGVKNYNITECNLRNNTKSIAGGAFSGCNNLTSISIPSGVEEIGEGAFVACKYLKQVSIPNSVKRIGHYCFGECTELNSINLPDGLESIGSFAFYGCSNIKEFVLPNRVKNVNSHVLGNCERLTSITIGDSVKTIHRDAFRESDNINKIIVSPGNPYLDSREDCNAVIETATNTLIYAYKNTTIPNSVTSIGDNAFWVRKGINNFTIPDNITSIGFCAFAHSDLQSITIPSSVKSIGEYAFYGCNSLKNRNKPRHHSSGDKRRLFYDLWGIDRTGGK